MSERDCREPTECRSCKALIIWAEHPVKKNAKTGKPTKMPLDLKPVEGGHYVLTYKPKLNRMEYASVHDVDPERLKVFTKRFESHFRTCPNASQHSTKGQ